MEEGLESRTWWWEGVGGQVNIVGGRQGVADGGEGSREEAALGTVEGVRLCITVILRSSYLY